MRGNFPARVFLISIHERDAGMTVNNLLASEVLREDDCLEKMFGERKTAEDSRVPERENLAVFLGGLKSNTPPQLAIAGLKASARIPRM